MAAVHIQNLANDPFLVLPLHNLIHKSMLQQKFRTLEPFRQLLPNGLLNNPGTRKTNQRMRLCQDNVAQHGKAGRDASCGRVGKYADKQLAGLMMAL